jgi:acetyl esterase/lipase
MILAGALDAAIPPEAMVEFCEKLKQANNRCELQIYPGVGHMLEPPQENGTDKENALRTKYDAYLKADQFLAALGYTPVPKQRN